jgi:DNA-binding cell septation regulator SpoVG
MKVTEVKLSLRDKEMLRAYVDIVLDDSLVIRDLRIIHNSRGYFVAMPSQPLRDVRRADTALIAHPIYRRSAATNRRSCDGGVTGELSGEVESFHWSAAKLPGIPVA